MRARVHNLIRADWDELDTDRARFFTTIGLILGAGFGAYIVSIIKWGLICVS